MNKTLLIAVMVMLSSSVAGAENEMKGSVMEMKGSGTEMKEGGAEQEAMMAKWQEYSTPGQGHKALNPLIGTWSYVMKHWMKAGAPLEESTGSSVSTWIMGGRFIEEKVKGTSMGQPFDGVNLMGYNNATKKYSSYWFDNMSTGSMFSEGTYDAAAKNVSSAGKFFCPMRSGETAYRSVLKITSDDSHSYEMYMTETDGTEFLAMRIDYTRQ